MTKKIYEDDKGIVYLREEPGETWVFFHPKVDGKELIPRGYMLGDNALRYMPVAPKPEQA